MGFGDLKKRFMKPAAPDGEKIVAEALQMRRIGRHGEAWEMLAAEVRRNPSNHEANKAFWDVSVQQDRAAEAARPLLRYIQQMQRQGETERAVFHWFELADRVDPVPPIDFPTRAGLAAAMVEVGHAEAAAELLDALQADLNELPLAPRLRLARVAAQCRHPRAEEMVRPLLTDPTVPEPTRRELEQALAEALARGLRGVADEETDDGPIELASTGPLALRLQVIPALPVAFDGDKLTLEIQGQGRRRMSVQQIQNLATGLIDDGNTPAFVVIDLLIDSLWADREAVRTVRFRSSEFDAMALMPGQEDSQLALAAWLADLLVISQAHPLPDVNTALGKPFQSFASIREYETTVLELTS